MIRDENAGPNLTRRRLVFSSGVGLLLAAGGGQARGQTPAGRRVGVLMPYPATDSVVAERVAGFRDELQKLGWAPGAISFVERWVGDDLEAIRRAAQDLVAARVAVVLTTGSRVVPIVQQATRTIPIVFTGISDPVGQKLVSSLARPGGNTTGNSLLEFVDGRSPLMGKLVEIARQLAPATRVAGLVFNPDNPASAIHAPSFQVAVAAEGWEGVMLTVRSEASVEAAFRQLGGRGRAVAILPSDLTLLAQRARIVSLAETLRVPAVYSDDGFVDIGGLASYSADRAVLFRRAAGYVDRILRGEAAGDMPVEQPTLYKLSLNLKTARALELQVPPPLLASADDVIE